MSCRNHLIRYCIDEYLSKDVIDIILEYVHEFEGHIISSFRSLYPKYLKALDRGYFVWYDSDKILYIGSSKTKPIELESFLDDIYINNGNIYTFPGNIIIFTRNDILHIYRLINLNNLKFNYFSLKSNSDITTAIQISETKYCIGMDDGIIQIFDIETASFEYNLIEQTREIFQLLVLPENLLASSSTNGDICIWNLNTKAIYKKFKFIEEEDYDFSDIQLTYIGNTRIMLFDGLNIEIWDYKVGKRLNSRLLKDFSESIIYDTNIILFGKDDILFLDCNTLETVKNFKVINRSETFAEIKDIKILSGNHLAILSSDPNLIIMDLTTGKIIQIHEIENEISCLTKLTNYEYVYASGNFIYVRN